MYLHFLHYGFEILYKVPAQSTELTKGPPELVQHFRLLGEFTSAQERCISKMWYGLTVSLACPSGEEGGNFLIQMTSLEYRIEGGRGRHSVSTKSAATGHKYVN